MHDGQDYNATPDIRRGSGRMFPYEANRMDPMAEILIVCISAPMAFILASQMLDRLVEHAHAAGLLDHPTERGSHVVPTPRVGGAPLAALVILAAFIALAARLAVGATVPGYLTPMLLALILGGAITALVGYRDDVCGMSPWIKLIGQGTAALCVTIAVGGFDAVAVAGVTIAPGRVLILAGCFLWMGWMMNMVNFMDGMDGMVSAFTLFCLAGFGLATAWLGETGRGEMLLLLAVFAGAMAAFHRRNVTAEQQKKTFMGDCGSQFTGLFLGLLSLTLTRSAQGQTVHMTLPLILFMPFLFDTVYTMSRRTARGANLLQAHHEHLYQRHLESGASHSQTRRIWMLIHLCQLALALMALWAGADSGIGFLIFLVSPLPMILYFYRIVRLEKVRVKG